VSVGNSVTHFTFFFNQCSVFLRLEQSTSHWLRREISQFIHLKKITAVTDKYHYVISSSHECFFLRIQKMWLLLQLRWKFRPSGMLHCHWISSSGHFKGSQSLHLQVKSHKASIPRRWRHYDPSKHNFLPSNTDLTSQRNGIFSNTNCDDLKSHIISLLLYKLTIKPSARGMQECPGYFYEEESFTNYYAQVCHLLKHKWKSCNTQSVFTTMNHDVLAEMIH